MRDAALIGQADLSRRKFRIPACARRVRNIADDGLYDARQIAMGFVSQRQSDLIWQSAPVGLGHGADERAHRRDRVVINILSAAVGIVEPLKDRAMRCDKPDKPVDRRGGVRRSEFVDDRLDRHVEIGRERLRLVPVNAAARPFEPSELAIHQGSDGLGPLRPRQRGGGELPKIGVALRFVEDQFRQLAGAQGNERVQFYRRLSRHSIAHSPSGLVFLRLLTTLRRPFASSRLVFEASVGRVARRGSGASCALSSSAARRSRASSRLRGWLA